ncbi:serine hydroxymethyltransferase [Salmonella enterica subsp. enterica]|uniref:Serine hydroxymethyltransferase n=1 Tax=Salmonella enterica I TaxID=59201 RepID=A0A447TXV0_SALET|nr:serine hydroxymethyltransferase [Salmonella enterica subsp. enterica]
MLKREMNIADYDAELWQAMEQEKVRQEEHIELIASEKLHQPARDAGAGVSADQQIR